MHLLRLSPSSRLLLFALLAASVAWQTHAQPVPPASDAPPAGGSSWKEVDEPCGSSRDVPLAGNGVYRLNVLVDPSSCPVTLEPTGLSRRIPGLEKDLPPLKSQKIAGNLGVDFVVAEPPSAHRLVLACGKSETKKCKFRYSLEMPPSTATPPSPPGPPPSEPAPPPPEPPAPPADKEKPTAPLCKDAGREFSLDPGEQCLVLHVYPDSECPVRVETEIPELAGTTELLPGTLLVRELVAGSNPDSPRKIVLSCGESDSRRCHFDDKEVPGKMGDETGEVKIACDRGVTLIDVRNQRGIVRLYVTHTGTDKDCEPEVRFSDGARLTARDDAPNPVTAKHRSEFLLGLGPNDVADDRVPSDGQIRISCGEQGEQCAYQYKLVKVPQKVKHPKPATPPPPPPH